jgi:2-aminoadipate transaminase
MMNVLSDRIKALQPSAIREIFKYMTDPNIISFAAGNPAPEAFPTNTVARLSAEIFEENPIGALQYSVSEGYTPLRDWLKADLAMKGCFDRNNDELIITAGAQQVMDLATKIISNEHDTIICESPSFIGSLNTFRSYRANLVGVPMDKDGMVPELLEEALKKHPRTAFIYIIPNFQNPTGLCTSLQRRKDILALAYKYNVAILEDNPYGDLRFLGADIPSIKSMDRKGHVLYAGTFSKILAPGLRVGFMSAPENWVQKAVVALQTSTVHTNIWAQMLCHKFVTQPDFEEYLENLQLIYRDKCKLMLDNLLFNTPTSVAFTNPQGGLFIWGTLPVNDATMFVKKLLQSKVAVVPGSAFLVNDTEPSPSFRLNFSTPTNEQILHGVDLLGAVAKGMFVD